MEKLIKLNFNSSGVLIDSDIDEIRQGDSGVKLVGSFTGKNNANYVARYTLTRPDEKVVKGIMSPSASVSTDFEKVLDSAYYFALHGEVTVTIFLFSGTSVIAQGQATISVERTDYSEESTITPDEYDELVNLIATKLNIKDGIITFDSIQDIDSYDNYEAGQFMFVLNAGSSYNNHTVLFQLNAQKTALTKVFDFTDINAGRVKSINLTIARTALNNSVYLQLIDDNGLTIATAIATINPATTTYAGLMSAEDKSIFDSIPDTYETKQHAENTYETKEDADENHENLQGQIDAIISKSDVVDVVGTYAELEDYDTSELGDRDIIKVLNDETHLNQRSYYRWLKDDEEFDYVGSEGVFYTKADTDSLFLKKSDAETIYLRKYKIFDHVPTSAELLIGELGVVPSIEGSQLIIGSGLKLEGNRLSTNALFMAKTTATEIVGKAVSVPNLTAADISYIANQFNDNMIPTYIGCSALKSVFRVLSASFITNLNASIVIALEQNGITYLVNYIRNGGAVNIYASDMPTGPLLLDFDIGVVEGTYEGELTKAESDRLFLHDNLILDFQNPEHNGYHDFLRKSKEHVASDEVIYQNDNWVFTLNSVTHKFVVAPNESNKLYQHWIEIKQSDSPSAMTIAFKVVNKIKTQMNANSLYLNGHSSGFGETKAANQANYMGIGHYRIELSFGNANVYARINETDWSTWSNAIVSDTVIEL